MSAEATKPKPESEDGAQRPVVILGIGGGGGTIVARAAELGGRAPVVLAAADTDREALRRLQHVETLPLSGEWTAQRGTGGDLLVGERAASATAGELEQLVRPARLLIVVTALGGGTGAGAAKVISRIAQKHGVLTILAATLPFSFEGNARQRDANDALEPLRHLADAVIAVPNDMLFNTMNADTPVPEAFALTDGIIARVALGLARLSFADGVLPADFSRLRKLLHRRSATCALAVGHGSGDNRWKSAVEEFMDCPLLGGPSALEDADFALLTAVGDQSLTIGEVRAAMTALQERFGDATRLITGAYVSTDVGGLELTGIVGRYHDRAPDPAPSVADHHAQRTTPFTRTAPRTAPVSTAKGQRRRPVQAELPLQEQSLGIFSHATPTTVRGENLDIPTFQRRGIHLDLGATAEPTTADSPPQEHPMAGEP